MTRKSDLLKFLCEALEMRVDERSAFASRQEEFIAIKQDVLDLMGSITDESVLAELHKLEEIKNLYISKITEFMYKEGLRDGITILQSDLCDTELKK